MRWVNSSVMIAYLVLLVYLDHAPHCPCSRPLCTCRLSFCRGVRQWRACRCDSSANTAVEYFSSVQPSLRPIKHAVLRSRDNLLTVELARDTLTISHDSLLTVELLVFILFRVARDTLTIFHTRSPGVKSISCTQYSLKFM